MKRNLIYFFVWAILLNTPTTLFCQKQGTLLIKGREISASATSLQIFKGSLLKDSIYTIPVENGNFCALLNMDEGIQEVAVLIGEKPIVFYASSGDVVDITYDFTKSSLLEIKGLNTLKTQLLSYDVSAMLPATIKRDSLFTHVINKATDDAEKYRLCNYYYNMELRSLLSKETIFKQQMEQYINELYFSYVYEMYKYQLHQFEHLSNTPAIGFAESKIVPGVRHFEKVSKTIFLQSPSYRKYLFDNFRFGKPDSMDTKIMMKYAFDEKKYSPWLESQKSMYIDDPFIKDWFKAKSVVFSYINYNLEEADKVMKLFLKECQDDLLKENVINSIKGVSFLKKGIKAPDFILQDELGKTISLTDFTGKVIYLNFWGIHCGPCIDEIQNSLPMLRNKYKKIAIITVCIEGKAAEWKDAITKYGMKDINLYDPMNKAAKEYNISSVPHNILIDKQGNIFEYNAARPDIYSKNDNSIEELTK